MPLKLLTIPFLLVLFFGSGCSSDEVVSADFLEYRKDDDGLLRLYRIGKNEPLGKWRMARVTQFHANGQKNFEIGIVDGLRHGSFFFWQPNGIKELTGSYENGKREGTFRAFGKAGELIYEKNFRQDELDGNFTLYYPFSKQETFRYFKKLKEKGLEPKKLPVRSHLRLEASFSNGIPAGSYRVYYHPRGQSDFEVADLLEEEGRFDDSGRLIGHQVKYYPKTEGLVVYLPDDQPLTTIHEPTTAGLSKAIDECHEAISEIPAYRNPKHLPAKVFCVDGRGSRISPVWSSEITELAIRNADGYILPERFPPNFESYQNQATPKARDLSLDLELSRDSGLGKYAPDGASVEIVALNEKGEVHDVIWQSMPQSGILSLEERILQKRKRIHRSWTDGEVLSSEWTVPSGLNLIIHQNSSIPDDSFLPHSSLK